MGKKEIKDTRQAAIKDAAYTIGDGHLSKLADKIKEDKKQMHNWYARGSKLYYFVVTKIYKQAQVSPDRLAPLEIPSNDEYFSKNPLLKIFELEVSAIKRPSFFKAQEKEQDTERPVILDLRNILIFGHEVLRLTRQAGHKTLRVIRLDARALLTCDRNILKHPDGWLNYELRVIASYLEAYAKQYRITHADTSQDIRSFIFKRLSLKENRISSTPKSTFFSLKNKPSKTMHDESPSSNLNKLRI